MNYRPWCVYLNCTNTCIHDVCMACVCTNLFIVDTTEQRKCVYIIIEVSLFLISDVDLYTCNCGCPD